MSQVLDWSFMTNAPKVSTAAVVVPQKTIDSTFLSKVSAATEQWFFSEGGVPRVQVNDATWTDRMVDRFTGYLDGKFLEFQEWLSQAFHNFFQSSLVFFVEIGFLCSLLWLLATVFKMMIHSKEDEDYVTNLIFGFGGMLIFKSLEMALLQGQ